MKRIIHTTLLAVFSLCLHPACEEKLDLLPPTLSAVSVTEVGVNTAKISSAITKSGNQEILDYGFTVSLSADAPVIGDGSIKKGAIDRATPTPIAINASLTGLQTATEYYVHAFALLATGPIFSEGVKFKTSNVSQPNVKTEGFDAVTINSAILKGSVLAKGSYPISEYGIVWSGTANPTTASAFKYQVKGDVAAVPASFYTEARGLSPNTTYHFRAYAISNGVTSYGADLIFKTTNEVQPQVQTGEARVNSTLALLFGQITGKGTSPITQYGICLATKENPTIGDARGFASEDVNEIPRSYSFPFFNLQLSTTYHYRAFVTMNGVTTYGENKTFRTNELQPTVETGDAKAYDYTAYLNGKITARGSAAITHYGVCWSETANPTISNGRYMFFGDVTTFPKSFQVYAQGLTDDNLYHYRAFVTMNGVTTYGADKTFKTPKHVN